MLIWRVSAVRIVWYWLSMDFYQTAHVYKDTKFILLFIKWLIDLLFPGFMTYYVYVFVSIF